MMQADKEGVGSAENGPGTDRRDFKNDRAGSLLPGHLSSNCRYTRYVLKKANKEIMTAHMYHCVKEAFTAWGP